MTNASPWSKFEDAVKTSSEEPPLGGIFILINYEDYDDYVTHTENVRKAMQDVSDELGYPEIGEMLTEYYPPKDIRQSTTVPPNYMQSFIADEITDESPINKLFPGFRSSVNIEMEATMILTQFVMEAKKNHDKS